MMDRAACNGFRYEGGAKGHYESYFQRANHPERPLAFWIRYTFFAPDGRPRDAVGELWAIYFDGESRDIVAVKEVHPLSQFSALRNRLSVRVDDAVLDERALEGAASCLGHSIAWDLAYTAPEPPMLLLPESLYRGPFPKARALVGAPLARFRGKLVVDGREIAIDDWLGSQNHNWGERHTDEYAWGQVAGFDGAPSTFLELSTARVKVGPVRLPWMTVIALRHEGRELRWSSIWRAVRARGRYEFFRWAFSSDGDDGRIEGRIDAPPDAFVGLPYDNPPGGRKTCLNSKIARCQLTVTPRKGSPIHLATKHRAAFEILTERNDHGVPVLGV
jgi:hypothetical protein